MTQKPIFNQLNKKAKDNKILILEKFKEDIQEIIEIFNLQYDYIEEHLKVASLEYYLSMEYYSNMLATAFRKNMFSFYSAFHSTQQGLFGSARIVLRNIYEFLLIGKYSAISEDNKFIDKWTEGKDVSLQREVFSNIISPKLVEIKELWKLLCKFTHSTIYAQQIDFNANRFFKDIKFNLILLKVLLEMNFHLLNSYYINSSLRYYTQESNIYPVNEFNKIPIKEKKKLLKLLFKKTKSKMEREPRKVIYDYKLKWKIKEKTLT